MNYIKELNAFYNQIVFNPLSGSAVALWNTLMHMNNACGWRKEFSAPASILQLKSGIKGTSFKRAREELQGKGYIRIKSRGGNLAPIYQMVSQWKESQQEGHAVQSFFVPSQPQSDHQEHAEHQAMNYQTDDVPVPASGYTRDYTADQQMENRTDDPTNRCKDHNADHNPSTTSASSPAPLYKQKGKQTQTKRNEPTTTDAIRFYQENFGVINAFVAEDIGVWITDRGEPLVLHAMKRALEQNKPTWRYVKSILQAWANKNILTVDQADAEDAAFRNRKRQVSHQKKGHSQEVIPDWFHNRKQHQTQHKPTLEPAKLDPADEAREKEEFEKELAAFLGRSNRLT